MELNNLLGIPRTFLDPVTHKIMRDPVIARDGLCYDRGTIEPWLARGNRISPITRLPLSSTVLIPNSTLKATIKDFFDNLMPKMTDVGGHAVDRTKSEVQVGVAGKANFRNDSECN